MQPPRAPRRPHRVSPGVLNTPIHIALTSPLCCSSSAAGVLPVSLQVSLTFSLEAVEIVQTAQADGRIPHRLHLSVLSNGACVTQSHTPMPPAPAAGVTITLTVPAECVSPQGVLYVVLFWGTQLQDAAPLLVLPETTADELHQLFMNMCVVQRHEIQQQAQQQAQQQQQLYMDAATTMISTAEIERFVWQTHFRGLAGDIAFIMNALHRTADEGQPAPGTAGSSSSSSAAVQPAGSLADILTDGSPASSAASSPSSKEHSSSSSSSNGSADPGDQLYDRLVLSAITSSSFADSHLPWISLIDPDLSVISQVAGRLIWFMIGQQQTCRSTLDMILDSLSTFMITRAHPQAAAADVEGQQQQQQQWRDSWLQAVMEATTGVQAEQLAVQVSTELIAAGGGNVVQTEESTRSVTSADRSTLKTQQDVPSSSTAASSSSSSSSRAIPITPGGNSGRRRSGPGSGYTRATQSPGLPTIHSSGGSSSSRLSGSSPPSAASSLPRIGQQQQAGSSSSSSVLAGSPLALLDTLLPPTRHQQQQQQDGSGVSSSWISSDEEEAAAGAASAGAARRHRTGRGREQGAAAAAAGLIRATPLPLPSYVSQRQQLAREVAKWSVIAGMESTEGDSVGSARAHASESVAMASHPKQPAEQQQQEATGNSKVTGPASLAAAALAEEKEEPDVEQGQGAAAAAAAVVGVETSLVAAGIVAGISIALTVYCHSVLQQTQDGDTAAAAAGSSVHDRDTVREYICKSLLLLPRSSEFLIVLPVVLLLALSAWLLPRRY